MKMTVTSSWLVAALLACACASRPLYFESGESWTLPVVEPLDDGQLAVPCMIEGKGPYLFLLNPATRFSSVDETVAEDLHLFSNRYRRTLFHL